VTARHTCSSIIFVATCAIPAIAAAETNAFDAYAAVGALDKVTYGHCGSGGTGVLEVTFETSGWISSVVSVEGRYDAATRACVEGAYFYVHVAPFAPPRRTLRYTVKLPDAAESPWTTKPAEGASDVSPPARPTRPHETWYGYQTLIADGAVLGFFLLVDAESKSKIHVVDTSLALLSGPTIHLANGNLSGMFASFLVRAPAAAAILKANYQDTCDPKHENGCFDAWTTLAVVAAITAITLDASVFSYVKEEAPKRKKSPSVGVTPTFARGFAGLSFSGAL